MSPKGSSLWCTAVQLDDRLGSMPRALLLATLARCTVVIEARQRCAPFRSHELSRRKVSRGLEAARGFGCRECARGLVRARLAEPRAEYVGTTLELWRALLGERARR